MSDDKKKSVFKKVQAGWIEHANLIIPSVLFCSTILLAVMNNIGSIAFAILYYTWKKVIQRKKKKHSAEGIQNER